MPSTPSVNTQLKKAMQPGLEQLAGSKGQLEQGFTTLSDILGLQGQTNPQAFNQQLANIARGTQQQQQSATGQLAGLGPGVLQSGMGQAILGAIGGAGQDRLAGARATEAQLTEQRKRDDLMLLLQMVLGPQLGLAGIQQQGQIAQQQFDMQNRGATIGALGVLGGGLLGGPFGASLGKQLFG